MAFAPVFQRPFAPTFDRHAAAAAAAADWWEAGSAPTPIAVYQPKGAASLAASYVNLVNPGTYDANPLVAPSWDATNGWGSDGTQYLDTGVTPANDQSYCMLVRYANATLSGNNRTLAGSYTGFPSQRFMLAVQISYTSTLAYSNGNQQTGSGSGTSGVVAVAADTGYLNGIVDASGIGAWGGVSACSIYIMGTNISDTLFFPYIGNVLAMAIWNTSTGHATWMPAVSAAVALI